MAAISRRVQQSLSYTPGSAPASPPGLPPPPRHRAPADLGSGVQNGALYRGKSVDAIYVWLLAVTALLVGVFVWTSVIQSARNTSLIREFVFSLNALTIGMAALGFGVLAWRIWMAVRYRAVPPASDADLPLVTVVIPAYNEGPQVLGTVRSVMASDYPDHKMRVICVDDGSTDDTYQWMVRARKEFPHRLRLIRQPKNRGKRQALLAGFHNAVGDVYVTIDSDSEILPGTLRSLVSPFVASPKVGAVAGNVRVLNRRDGAIPSMLDVSFTTAFDFVRSGQSVYGGVYCTPGALSAYRASLVHEHLRPWVDQTFMGVPATIGEDRALTNCILRSGYRVVYQRDAVVLTKIPATFRGLRRMLLRWARSNVRESLIMSAFMFRDFRPADTGAGYIRFFGALQILRLSMGEVLKAGLVLQLFMNPVESLRAVLFGCLFASLLPAIVYQIRYRNWFGWRWALPYSFFWLACLSWISVWGLLSASRSGWLTRTPQKVSLQR
jgi:hyaluronan synthase